MRGRTLALYAVCCLIWGSTWLVIKVAITDLPPFLFAGVRMALACALLTPLALRSRDRPPDRVERRDIALAGLLQMGASYAMVFMASKAVGSGLTAVLFATFPIWVGLFAHTLLPNEPLTPARLAAAALGLAGVAVLEAPGLTGIRMDVRVAAASTLPLGSALVSAFANVWIKKRLGGVSPLVNLWGQTLVGAVFLLTLAVVFERGLPAVWSARAVGALLYLAVFGTVVTFLCLFWLIPRIPMAAVGAISLIDTVIAVALGAAILAEPVDTRLVAGAALVLVGAAVANRRPSAPKAAVT